MTQPGCEGAESEKDFTVANIDKVTIKFRPGKILKNAIRDMEFEKE